MKMYYSEFEGDEELTVDVNAEIVAKAEKELEKYMEKKGSIYSVDTRKEPNVNFFFSAFFGKCEDGYWVQPNIYNCTNKNVAERMYNLAKKMEYHDRFNQCGKDVSIIDKQVAVFGFDY